MDPNNQNPQVDTAAVNKLEQDLKDLSAQTPVAPQTPAPAPQPVVPPLEVPETPAVMPEAPVAPPVTPTETNVPVEEKPKKGSPIMIVAIILALVAVLAVVVYVFGAKLLTPQPTPAPVAVVTPSPTPDVTSNWKTYTNTAIGFSVKYPSNWRLVGTEASTDMIGFGPANVGQDVQWGITISSDKTANQIIADMGKQFGTDRKVQQDQITVNGLTATKVSVTTSSIPTWNLQQILITNGGKIITISNGAIIDANFVIFYNSFKFTEATPSASPIVSPTASPSSSPSATPIVY
jgi:hypothetical protein